MSAEHPRDRVLRDGAARRIAVALAIAATGCAALESLGILPLRFESADDRGTELRVLGPSSGRTLGGAALRLWEHVDAGAIQVEFPLGLPLVAFQDTVIPLDVSIGFDDLPAIGRIASAAIAGERLDYRLDGTFAVEAGRYGEPRFGPWKLLEGELRVR